MPDREWIYRFTNSGKMIPGKELVRCKDCRHDVRLDDSSYYICSKPFASNRETHTAEWFCADGERKESEQE